MVASDGYIQQVPKFIADEYGRKNITFLSPDQIKRRLGDRATIEAHIAKAFESPYARTTPTASEISAAAEMLQHARESSDAHL
jgi:hypothetical protein